VPKQEKNNRCPCCGQGVVERIGLPDGRPFFGVIQQAVFNAIRKHPGISAEEVFERVWGSVERDAKIVHVVIKIINGKIEVWGLQIKGHIHRGYRLLSC